MRGNDDDSSQTNYAYPEFAEDVDTPLRHGNNDQADLNEYYENLTLELCRCSDGDDPYADTEGSFAVAGLAAASAALLAMLAF